MKVLTVWQPWASLIMGNVTLSPHAHALGCELPKNIENRSWDTNYRGDLLIHAGKRVDTEYLNLVLPDWEPPTGVILGVVNLHQITNGPGILKNCWAALDQYHWWLRRPRPFKTPVPMLGAQGLFNVRPEAVEAVRTAMAEIGEAFE